jgi:hypothetical protein
MSIPAGAAVFVLSKVSNDDPAVDDLFANGFLFL